MATSPRSHGIPTGARGPRSFLSELQMPASPGQPLSPPGRASVSGLATEPHWLEAGSPRGPRPRGGGGQPLAI